MGTLDEPLIEPSPMRPFHLPKPDGRVPATPKYVAKSEGRAPARPKYFRLFGALVILLLASRDANAQVQQAWVARYNNGITNGTNQAVKMSLDSGGNIIVVGVSQNTNNQLGYVTIKYAPNGTQLWAARFDSTNYPNATPSAFALDSSNDVIVTGSALTVKYDTNGTQLWTAAYNGAAIGMDMSNNAVVTGFDSGFNTIKLGPTGSNLWSVSYISPYGPAISQALVVDGIGSAYVAGSDTYVCYSEGPSTICYNEALLVKYDQNGNQLWETLSSSSSIPTVQVAGLALDLWTNIYVLSNPYLQPYSTFRFNGDGIQTSSSFNPTANGGSMAYGLAIDSMGNAIVTGYDGHYSANTPFPIGTYKIGTNGAYLWTNLYYSIVVSASVGTAVAVDSANSAYVTGYSPGISGTNNIVTIKYAANGNQLWLQSYNGLNAGNDAGNAIAVDNNGNVYVTGYETLPGGGTGIVTIKYSPITIQRQTNGTVLIETQGSPGESFDIQASSDLLNWLDLGTYLADTNGLMQFDDTNAPNFPARFYYTNPR